MLTKRDTQTIINAIIKYQRQIIGPLAVAQANKVVGLKLNDQGEVEEVKGSDETILSDLVKKYEILFGQASVDACKESIREILPTISSKDLPEFLR